MKDTTTAGGTHPAIATTITSASPWPAAAPGPVPRQRERLRAVRRRLLEVGDHRDVGVQGDTRIATDGGIVPVTTLWTGAVRHLSLPPTPRFVRSLRSSPCRGGFRYDGELHPERSVLPRRHCVCEHLPVWKRRCTATRARPTGRAQPLRGTPQRTEPSVSGEEAPGAASGMTACGSLRTPRCRSSFDERGRPRHQVRA